MKFSTQQLLSGKWGIYSDARLLATVTSQETCEVILSNLSNGQKEIPEGDSSALYQMPERHTPRQNAKIGKRVHRKLVSSPNSKVLKAQRLKTASVEAQKRHVVASDEATAACRTWLKRKAGHA